MLDLNRELKADNMDELLEILEYEKNQSEENTFLDLNEKEVMDDQTWRRMYNNEFGYAVVIR